MNQPGETLQMTKPILLIRANGNENDALALAKLGLDSVSEPYLEISPVTGPGPAKRLLDELEKADWLIATSLNGGRFWAELVGQTQLTAAIWKGLRRGLNFAAIGEATAIALKSFGAQEVLVPAVAYGDALAKVVIAAHGENSGHAEYSRPLAVIPSGNLAMETLQQELTDAHWAVHTEVLYVTAPVKEAPATAGRVISGEFAAVLLRAPSAAKAFAEFVDHNQIPVICGGKTTARKAQELGLNVVAVCSSPSSSAAAQTIFDYVTSESIESLEVQEI
jgi:uroporphyrinogen-III synthase